MKTAAQSQMKTAAQLSERKTVHEWLNSVGVPGTEHQKPICLLRRLSIACDRIRLLDRYRRLLFGPEYAKDSLHTRQLLAIEAEKELLRE